jgi:hypothetical protein
MYIVNRYKGIVITDLVAPPFPIRISTFKEALEKKYTVITEPDPYISGLFRTLYAYAADNNHKVPFMTAFEYLINASRITQYISALAGVRSNATINRALETSLRVTWEERQRIIILNGTQAEFLKCNRTLFVDTLENLRERVCEFNPHLPSSAHSLYIGKEFIGEERRIWYSPDLQWDKGLLSTRMSSILHSGIYKKWRDLRDFKYTQYYQRVEGFKSPPAPLGLGSNISSLFLLFVALLSLCLTIFLVEVRKKMHIWIRFSLDMIRKVWQMSKRVNTCGVKRCAAWMMRSLSKHLRILGCNEVQEMQL